MHVTWYSQPAERQEAQRQPKGAPHQSTCFYDVNETFVVCFNFSSSPSEHNKDHVFGRATHLSPCAGWPNRRRTGQCAARPSYLLQDAAWPESSQAEVSLFPPLFDAAVIHGTDGQPRKIGQNSEVEIQQKDMLAELQRKERARLGLPPITIADSNSTESEEAQRKREAVAALADLDAEDSAPQQGRQRYDLDEDQSESSSSDSSDDDDDEDEEEDTAALLRELEKIRAERAAEKEAQERAKAAKEEEERNASIMAGNPLLQRHEPGTPAESDTSSQAGFRVQRK